MKLVGPKTITAILSFTALATAAQPSSGCAKTSLPDDVKLGKSKAVDITSTSVNDTDSTRSYRIFVPNSYKTGVPVPLILSFHGRTQTAKYQEDLSQFTNATFGYAGISVFPQGIAPNGTTQWQGDPDQPAGIDDIHFSLEILDYITSNYCIDESAIYANGKSNGGGFTGVLACSPKASQKFAAFAAVSGAYYLDRDTQQLPPCNPALNGARKAIPFMELHGLIDNTIKYHGGPNTRKDGNTVDIPTYMDGWAKRDGIDPTADVTGTLCSGDMLVTTFKWGDTVKHLAYSNMDHDWMSQFGNADSTEHLTCAEADATRVVLDWFKGWTLTGKVA